MAGRIPAVLEGRGYSCSCYILMVPFSQALQMSLLSSDSAHLGTRQTPMVMTPSSLPDRPVSSLSLRCGIACPPHHRSIHACPNILIVHPCAKLTLLCTLQDDEEMEKRVTRKLHWHIMSRFVMLTVLNHMDRANLVCCICLKLSTSSFDCFISFGGAACLWCLPHRALCNFDRTVLITSLT